MSARRRPNSSQVRSSSRARCWNGGSIPTAPARSPYAPELGDRVLLLCDHGESSSLAAATLVDLGFSRAGDIVGGFAAWVESGLPVVDATPAGEGPPGMAPGVTAGD